MPAGSVTTQLQHLGLVGPVAQAALVCEHGVVHTGTLVVHHQHAALVRVQVACIVLGGAPTVRDVIAGVVGTAKDSIAVVVGLV